MKRVYGGKLIRDFLETGTLKGATYRKPQRIIYLLCRTTVTPKEESDPRNVKKCPICGYPVVSHSYFPFYHIGKAR